MINSCGVVPSGLWGLADVMVGFYLLQLRHLVGLNFYRGLPNGIKSWIAWVFMIDCKVEFYKLEIGELTKNWNRSQFHDILKL